MIERSEGEEIDDLPEDYRELPGNAKGTGEGCKTSTETPEIAKEARGIVSMSKDNL